MNMDNFFDDMANGTPGTAIAAAVGVGVNGTGAAADGSRKRKSDGLEGICSVDSKEDPASDNNRRSSKLLYNDSFAQQFASGPLASFGVFGSLSNGSNDGAEKKPDATTMDPQMPTLSSKSKTTLLTPRNRLPSPQRSLHNPPPHHRHPHMPPHPHPLSSQEAGIVPSAPDARPITDEHSHPSKGNLQTYDPALYERLRNTRPPSKNANHTPTLLIPRDRQGNRLAIIRGSGRQHSDFQIDDCVSIKTYAFYKFLREIYPALDGCSYLLPGLQNHRRSVRRSSSLLLDDDLEEELDCTINVSQYGSFKLGHVPGMTRSEKSKLKKSDLAIAKQRVECAIFAFGGTVTRKPPCQPQSDKLSIFRTRNESSSSSGGAPSPSKSSQGNSSAKRKNRQLSRSNSTVRREKYETKLRQQYFEHGNRLSWDVQANLSLTLDGAKTFDDDVGSQLKKSGSSMDQSDNSRQQRKNRCKKCGQIKQGHICPYQSSLQRSIGVMVYPSANAHVADEPGSLCEMNNFISIKSSSFEASMSSNERKRQNASTFDKNDVSKTKMARTMDNRSIQEINPFRRKSILVAPKIMCGVIDDKRSDEEEGRRDDTTKTDVHCAPDLLFQPKMEITLDQYRTITPKEQQSSLAPSSASSSSKSSRDYTYPQVPLTFSQRKSMSDALFSLSKLIPKLTDECALVLTEARRKDQWDLAVAELMTQVICVLHCSPERDYTLEGLRRYLMGLGIVC